MGPAVDPELGLLTGLRWRGRPAADPTQALRSQPLSTLGLCLLPVGLACTALPSEDTPADRSPPWPPPKARPALCSRLTGSIQEPIPATPLDRAPKSRCFLGPGADGTAS